MVKVKFDETNKRTIAIDNDVIIGECDFEINEQKNWNIVHTIVNESHKGQGIARRLVELVIEKANKNNTKVVAECSYAIKILKEREKNN